MGISSGAEGPLRALYDSNKNVSLQFPSDLQDYSQSHFVRFTILENEGVVFRGNPTPPDRFTSPERNSEGIPIPSAMRISDGGGIQANVGESAINGPGRIAGGPPSVSQGIAPIAQQSAQKTAELQSFMTGQLKTRIEKFVGPAVKDAIGYGASRFLPPSVGGGLGGGLLGGITGALGSAVSGLASGGLGGALSGLTGSISGSVGGALSGALGTLTGSIGGQLGSALGQIGDRIGGQLGNALGGIVQNQLIGLVGQAQGSLGGILTGGVAGLASPIINNIVRETAGSTTIGAISAGLGRAFSTGSDPGTGLFPDSAVFNNNTLNEINQVLGDAGGAMTTTLQNQVSASVPSAIPSTEMASRGEVTYFDDALRGKGTFAGSQGGTATSFSDVKGGTTKIKGDILLYLPIGVSESYQPKWTGMDLGLFGVARASMKGEEDANFFENVANKANRTGFAQEVLGNIIGGKLNNEAVKKEFLKSGVFAGLAGEVGAKAVNPHFETYFESVAPRTFTFNFKFAPKNKEESGTVADIIRTFKYYAAPGVMEDAARYWTYPMFFGIEYWNEAQTHKILPCALENISVNYGASGTNHTFYDGYPIQTDMTLTFKETELLTREKFSRAGGY